MEKQLQILNYRKDLVGDPKTGILHGGVITTLLDSCCGAAVMTAGDPKTSTATIDKIDYMRPAKPDTTITAEAICYKVTNSVAFVKASAQDGTKKTPVATANIFTSPLIYVVIKHCLKIMN